MRNSPSLVRIKHSCVQNTVQIQCYVVGRNRTLAGNLNGYFLQALDVCDSINHRSQDRQSGFQDAAELSHSLDDPCRLLWHKSYDCVGGQPRFLEVRGQRTAEAATVTGEAGGKKSARGCREGEMRLWSQKEGRGRSPRAEGGPGR
jgi:hypothetical protein